MRKAWLTLVVILTANGTLCRADETDGVKPAPIERKADAADVKKDNGRDYVEAIDARDAAAWTKGTASKSGIICNAPAKCCLGRGAECCKSLWAWMTYCPLKKSCLCDCCHKCNDVPTPPLYTYFLDPYHACASGNGCAACEKPGCASCGHR
jgi:hypothetical protein